MGFFGEEIGEQPVQVTVPTGHRLALLQACLPAEPPSKTGVVLWLRPQGEEQWMALCRLGSTGWSCSLQAEVGPEDSPILLRCSSVSSRPGEETRLHLTGSWTWTDDEEEEEEDDDDDEDDDEEDDEERKNNEEQEQGQERVSKKRKHQERAGVTEAEVAVEKEKKTSRKKRGAESVAPASELVVVSKPPAADGSARKPWKVKPQNDEGVLVPSPKQKTLNTGVLITDYVMGKGVTPKLGSHVMITYEGMFPNGKVFDKNQNRKQPLKFRMGSGQVIRGLDLGMDKMRVGGSREIVIPPALGYGDEGIGDIPGNQTLVFRITLIGIKKKSLSKK